MSTGSVASHNSMLRSDVKLYTLRGHFMPTDRLTARPAANIHAACSVYAAGQPFVWLQEKTLFKRCTQLSGVSSMWYSHTAHGR